MTSVMEILAYVTIVVSILHIASAVKYSYKRRLYEKMLQSLLVLLIFIELAVYTYIFLVRDYTYQIVYRYMYNEATPLHLFSSILFSNPLLISLALLAVSVFVTRFLLSGYIGRENFRRFIWGSSLYIMVIHICLLLSNIYVASEVNYSQGVGGYIYQSEPIFIFLYLTLMLGAWASIFSGLLLSSTWVRKIDRVLRWVNLLSDASLIFFFISFIIRIYLNILYESRRSFLLLRALDILIIAGIATVLFSKDSLRLGYRRVLGCLAFSSTILITFFTMLLTYLSPPVLLGSVNAVDLYTLSPSLFLPLIVGFILMGREVYRRPFYPWMSEDDDYFIRVSSSSVYFLIILASLYMALTLSVYYTSGSNPFPSSDFTYSVYVLFYISIAVIPLSSVIIMKWRNFYLLYGILTLFLVVFIGFKTYNVLNPKPYVPILTIVSVIASMYWLFRRGHRRGIIIYSLLMSLAIGIIFIGGYTRGTYDTGNIIELKTMSIDGHEVNYVSHRLINSSVEVMARENNVTLSYYRGLELVVEVDGSNHRLTRIQQPAIEAIFSRGVLIDDDRDLVKIFITTFTADGSSITLALAKYQWVNRILLLIYGVVGAIALILYNREL